MDFFLRGMFPRQDVLGNAKADDTLWFRDSDLSRNPCCSLPSTELRSESETRRTHWEVTDQIPYKSAELHDDREDSKDQTLKLWSL